jgi:hypothetical protein
MNLKILLSAVIGLVIVISIGLAISNPTLAQFRQTILTGVAEQEANRQEQIERQAIEREAASMESYFSAAHYEGSRLDALTIQTQYPRLGASLASQHPGTQGASLSERLAHIKQRALQRITVTRETTLYSLLADLSIHTTRLSYGLWSRFTTCNNNRLHTYLGIAGQFYEDNAGTCLSSR